MASNRGDIAMKEKEPENLYDVIVIDKATKEIIAMLGINQEYKSAKHTYNHAEKTISPTYSIDVVEAGLFEKGSIYR